MDQFYKYFRWLSLDIVLGAIFFLMYLGQFYGVVVQFSTYVALASAVWLIYTADHLMDAARVVNPTSERHALHKRHFLKLILIGGIVLICALINLHFLDIEIIRYGAILSAACVAYLLLVYFYKKFWVKELLVALGYAMGIFLVPLTRQSFQLMDLFFLLQLALVAFLNLLIFSHFDSGNDEKDGFNSLALRLGGTRTVWLIWLIAMLSFLLCLLWSLMFGYSSLQAIYGLMTGVLFLIFWRKDFFMTAERFRILGDGVFYIPLIFLLF